MAEPTRKQLLDLLRRWSEESYPYPSAELISETVAVLAPKVKVEMEGQKSLANYCLKCGTDLVHVTGVSPTQVQCRECSTWVNR